MSSRSSGAFCGDCGSPILDLNLSWGGVSSMLISSKFILFTRCDIFPDDAGLWPVALSGLASN